MKKIFILIFILGITLSGCDFLSRKQPAALKITTSPQATIFIDGKHAGTSPYENKDLEAGEITLKLVPEQTNENAVPFEGLIELTSGVVTIVNHQFATEDTTASGELLTLQPNNRSVASLSVVSQPDAAVVRLDGESKGFTPLVLNQVEAGDHQLSITSPGYNSRTVNIRTETGYRLTVSSILSKQAIPEPITIEEDKESTSSAIPTSEEDEEDEDLTDEDTDTTTPTPKPTTTSNSNNTTLDLPYVKINQTPTGWLRVRSEPSLAGEEIAKIEPGETYPFIEKQSGWYNIELNNGEDGWIAGQYAELYE